MFSFENVEVDAELGGEASSLAPAMASSEHLVLQPQAARAGRDLDVCSAWPTRDDAVFSWYPGLRADRRTHHCPRCHPSLPLPSLRRPRPPHHCASDHLFEAVIILGGGHETQNI